MSVKEDRMFIADFHIHSKYSRATSKNMEVPALAKWAKMKGVSLLGTGDFTHHLWLEELERLLQPCEGKGVYTYEGVHFILSAEVANIFSEHGKGYRVHTMILAPTFKVVEEINKCLASHGNIASDGRPILGLSCKRMAEEILKISPDIMIIPAHIWTPWFSLFGSESGFNKIEECFDKYTDKITALETGLSSDPAMNWRLSALDRFSLVSNSDAHSPSKIGREANVFGMEEIDYFAIKEVLQKKDKERFLYTVEFFPEEGKYHFDGHRNCGLRLHPSETKKYNGICPKCKRKITKGVVYRVDELADRAEGFVPPNAIPFKSLVPFDEIIAEAKGIQKTSKQVEKEYAALVQNGKTEFDILLHMNEAELRSYLPPRIAEGVLRVRNKQLEIAAGYDGEYGIIKIFNETELAKTAQSKQMTLF